MKKTRFSEEQMVKIVREADQGDVADVAKKHGISGATIYALRKRSTVRHRDVEDVESCEPSARLPTSICAPEMSITPTAVPRFVLW